MKVMATSTGLFHGFVNLHVNIYQSGSNGLVVAALGGLIGGVTVFLGVRFADKLAQRRARTQKFDDELFNLMSMWADVGIIVDAETPTERARHVARVITQFGRVITASQPPQHKAEEKVVEALTAFAKFNEALLAWSQGGAPPEIDKIGSKLFDLGGEEFRRWRSASEPSA
jgi:hypothetical protein